MSASRCVRLRVFVCSLTFSLVAYAIEPAVSPPPNSDPTYQQLRKLSLGSETISVNNLALKRDASTFHLRSGTVCFVAPVQELYFIDPHGAPGVAPEQVELMTDDENKFGLVFDARNSLLPSRMATNVVHALPCRLAFFSILVSSRSPSSFGLLLTQVECSPNAASAERYGRRRSAVL